MRSHKARDTFLAFCVASGPPPAAKSNALLNDSNFVVPRLPCLSQSAGQVPNPGGPADFAKSIDEQRAVLAKAAKDLGILPK
jgi:hypothetical protein